VSYLKALNVPTDDLFYVDKSTERIKTWQTLIFSYLPNDTEEDMELNDVPASWGNCGYYRLLGSTNNFFSTRGSNLPQ
jgi:hypothetical protein